MNGGFPAKKRKGALFGFVGGLVMRFRRAVSVKAPIDAIHGNVLTESTTITTKADFRH